MIKVHLVPAGGGAPLTLQAKAGQSLMQAAVAANVAGIDAECGGSLTCATCHVYVREPFAAQLPPAGSDELRNAGVHRGAAASRTAGCRARSRSDLALDGLTVDLPATQT